MSCKTALTCSRMGYDLSRTALAILQRCVAILGVITKCFNESCSSESCAGPASTQNCSKSTCEPIDGQEGTLCIKACGRMGIQKQVLDLVSPAFVLDFECPTMLSKEIRFEKEDGETITGNGNFPKPLLQEESMRSIEDLAIQNCSGVRHILCRKHTDC